MELLAVEEATDESMLGQRIRVQGWVHHQTETDDYIDLVMRDATGFLVTRFRKDSVEENTAVQAAGINKRSSIEVEGVLNRDKKTRSGYRLEAVDLQLVDEAEDIAVNEETGGLYRDINELWTYPDRYTALNRLGSKVFNTINGFFRKNNWTFTDPPVQVDGAEGGGLFVDDGRVSDPILFLEALSYILGKTYTIYEARNRVFAGAATWTDLPDIEAVGKDLVSRVMVTVAKESYTELDLLQGDYSQVRASLTSFETFSYDEVLEEIDEDELNDQAFSTISDTYDHPLIIRGKERDITNAFLAGEDTTVETASIIAPQGCGRLCEVFAFETEPGAIIDRVREAGENPDDYEWLLDVRREGVVPHTGIRVFHQPFVEWLAGIHHGNTGQSFSTLRRDS